MLKKAFNLAIKSQKYRHLLSFRTILSQTWRRIPIGSLLLRSYFDAVERPAYCYGVLNAVMLAKSLGYESISVIEFGVAGGNGLLILEKYAINLGQIFGVDTKVLGYDSTVGLPTSVDEKDLPYWFFEGLFTMEVEKLQQRLKKSKLVIGQVSQTVQSQPIDFSSAPIGFISFDLDYYSSTRDAFAIFDHHPTASFLPRVLCYFDDIIGNDLTPHNEHIGQLAAISEFNRSHHRIKISR